MLTTDDAFKKFRTRLEPNSNEVADASRRQKDIREFMDEKFQIEDDFLTGSYARWTKTKPLRDIDIFCVLKDEERHYRNKHPSALLGAVENVLVEKYGRSNVRLDARSVTVDFGVKVVIGEDNDKVMSFDVVPAFIKKNYYEIPDTSLASGWLATNPKEHYDLAVKAQEAYSREWKGIVRMVKAWNRHHGSPITPSFLIEVMALQLLHPPFGNDFRFEMKGLFASMADRIHDRWPDPAGVGPDISDSIGNEQRRIAKEKLQQAEKDAAVAIQLEKQGKQGDALKKWRELLGPFFPLS